MGTASGAYPFSSGAQLCVSSYDAAAKTAAMRRGNAQVIAPTAVTVENTNARLADLAAGLNGTTAVKPIRSGSLYDPFVLNVPVHTASAAASLAKLEAYVKAHYPTI